MKFLDQFKSLFGSGDSSSTSSSQESHPVNQLIGKIGETLTPLRTSGYIDLEGKRMEVTSSKGYVPKGRLVRIIGKKMGWYLVEPV